MSFRKEYTKLQEQLGGTYLGRNLINSHTRVDRGVLFVPGLKIMEATVVDFDKDNALRSLYDEVLETHRRLRGGSNKEFILHDTFDVIKRAMPYNLEYVKRIARQYNGAKVLLGGFFIGHDKGSVCRHQALGSAAILERMVDEGLLAGKARINWNYHPCLGGHAWAEYRTSQGELGVLDIAQDYFGYPESGKWGYKAENQHTKFDL